MIKLLVGLGNPGREYEKTRHNAGFLFLDSLAEDYHCTWAKHNDFQAIISEYSLNGEKIFLLKPQTYMNRSGQSVGKVVRYYKLKPEEILVIHDELDFPAGIIKLKKAGGHAGHNGLRDIIGHLNSNDFYRLRLGIGRPSPESKVADYVLSAPSKPDFTLLLKAIEQAKAYFKEIVTGDMGLVMNQINSQS